MGAAPAASADDYEQEDHETNDAEPRLDELMAKMAGEPGHDVSGSDISLIEVVPPRAAIAPESASRQSGRPLPSWAAGIVKHGPTVVEAAEDDSPLEEGGSSAVVDDRLVTPRTAEKSPLAKIKSSLIKMPSCGGAPDSMVPFSRAQSPWGSRKEFIGVLQKPLKGAVDSATAQQRRRGLLGDSSAYDEAALLPTADEFGGWLEPVVGYLPGEDTQEVGLEVNATGSAAEFSEMEAFRRAWEADRMEDPWRHKDEDATGGRVYLGSHMLRLLRSWAGEGAPEVAQEGEEEAWQTQEANTCAPQTPRANSSAAGVFGPQRALLGLPPRGQPQRPVPVRRVPRAMNDGRARMRRAGIGSSSATPRSARTPRSSRLSEMRRTGCSGTMRRVTYENEGYGPRSSQRSRPSDSAIKSCLNDSNKCTAEAFSAAKRLSSISQLSRVPKASLGAKRYRSCALVGNAGHLIKKQYGPYIDRHEAVVRFNVLGLNKFSAHVGSRTTFRVLNNARSADACCSGKLPEGKDKPIGLIMWYPAGQAEMKKKCKSKYPKHKVFQLSRSFITQEVRAINSLRGELQRMGLGSKLGNWKQLTSGGHAILLFNKVCDSISLYGFTTWSRKGPDQYAGRKVKTGSGTSWHDWNGESLAWRLMFAAGQLQICSK